MSDLTDIYGCHVCGFMTCTCLSKPTTQYDELIAAIVEAVPEIAGTCNWCRGLFHFCSCNIFEPREITLEDVLRALHCASKNSEHLSVETGTDGQMWIESGNGWHRGCSWQLGKPLSEQSPETISFLSNLLL